MRVQQTSYLPQTSLTSLRKMLRQKSLQEPCCSRNPTNDEDVEMAILSLHKSRSSANLAFQMLQVPAVLLKRVESAVSLMCLITKMERGEDSLQATSLRTASFNKCINYGAVVILVNASVPSKSKTSQREVERSGLGRCRRTILS